MVFLLLLLFVVAFGALARKLQTPYPIILVIAGALLAFVPAIPNVPLNPDIIFFIILPPLLYSAAWLTSWREFSYNLVSILMLAFGLVAFTVLGVSAAAHWFFPGFDWRLGFVLGAIVAPTDALAATSIAKRIGLPNRIVDILEGESLVNDASGLLALEFGIAMVVRGQTPTVTEGLGRIAFLVFAGIAVGLFTGWIVDRIERQIDDGPIEIAISILVPYAAYFGADRIHASGVLAVVVCGLYLSRRREMLNAALAHLEDSRKEDASEFQEIYDDLTGHYRHRLAAVSGHDDPENGLTLEYQQRHARLLRDLLRVERQTALRLRNQGRINDETLRQLEYKLDLREANPSASA